MRNKIRSIVWDMGGVILRTEDQTPRIQLANRLGIEPDVLYDAVFNSTSAYQATLGEIDVEKHWEAVRKKFDLEPAEMHQFAADFWGGDRQDAELVRFIQSLRPQYTTALLSNAWSDARAEMTRRFSFLDAFDHIVFSAEVGMAKPDPGIYLHILEKMSLKAEQAVFVDDVIDNVEAASRLGMHGIHFRQRKQVLDELAALNIGAETG